MRSPEEWTSIVVADLRLKAIERVLVCRAAGDCSRRDEVLVELCDREIERRTLDPLKYRRDCTFGQYEVIADVDDLA